MCGGSLYMKNSPPLLCILSGNTLGSAGSTHAHFDGRQTHRLCHIKNVFLEVPKVELQRQNGCCGIGVSLLAFDMQCHR